MQKLSCNCGNVEIAVDGAPIISAQCYCSSCQSAGEGLRSRVGSPAVLQADGGTPYVLYRKDRVRFLAGQDRLVAYRLAADAPTRRVVASCCNTPLFLEFQGGHWLSLYAGLWPNGSAPAPDLLTQTADAPAGVVLDADIPRGRLATMGFYGRLLGAWIAMGFRVPAVEVAEAQVVLKDEAA